MSFLPYIYYQILIWLDGWHPDEIRKREGARNE